jgi:large subunit ribosomal protein L30
MSKSIEKIRVTLVKSPIGCNQRQRACVAALGLRKRQSTRILEKTPATLGLVNKVHFLVQSEEV